MKVKFKDGTIKECSAPTEQKVFKEGKASGWILSFALVCDMTSAEVDNTLSEENISDLTFISADENGNEHTFLLYGYNHVSSAIIRHSEDTRQSRVELHLTKGV